ncbi:MAG: protein BatD, partial [Bacteroidetes bacterium]
MTKTRNRILALLWILPLLAFGQNEARFEAWSDARKVVEGNYFEVSFTLKNASGDNFTPPDFGPFTVISGPNSSMSTQIINGVISRQMGYSYTLLATRPGKFTIGPATIRVNGKTLKTSPLQIEVVKGQKGQKTTADPESEAFIRAEPSTTDALIGQQILLDYKLYTTVNIDAYAPLEESDYPGFYAQEIKRYNNRVMREVINGVQYTTKVLKRVALFPQQAGILSISPMRMRLEIVTGEGRQFGFFFRNNTVPVIVRTPEVEIKVHPYPADAPPTFTGAVGLYAFQASVDNQFLTTDDALKIKMLINGNGDIKRLQAPPTGLPRDSFEIFEPKVLDERIFENQGELNGRKIFEIAAVPKFPGRYTFRPKFTYFDTDSLKFVTLQSGPFNLIVRQGSGTTTAAPTTTDDQQPRADIRFIKTQTHLRTASPPFYGSRLFYLLLGLPVLFLAGAALYRQILEKQSRLDLGTIRRRRANRIALKHLKTAQKHLQNGQSQPFYDEVSRAFLGYVRDKLNIPTAELTKENVREKLEKLEVATPQIERFMKIIQT